MIDPAYAGFVRLEKLPENADYLVDEAYEAGLVAVARAVQRRVYVLPAAVAIKKRTVLPFLTNRVVCAEIQSFDYSMLFVSDTTRETVA